MEIAAHVRHEIDAERASRSVDAAIARLAGRQHGVVARAQLAALGLGHGEIDHRVASRRLHPIHRGVYAVGHRVLSRHAAWMGAVLAGGDSAVLSVRSAGALWAIRDTARSKVDVTVPRHRRSRPGLDLHQVALPADEVTCHRGIPVTTPARTLFDLAAVLKPHQLARAVDQAEIHRLTSPTSLGALLARHPGRPGTSALNAILDAGRIGTLTRSDLEALFLGVLDAHGLPRPQANASIETRDGRPVEPDCLWPQHRLIVELDGYETHATRQAFERDRARDRRLQADGWRVVRITDRQLAHEPHTIASELRSLLAGRDTVPTP